MRADQTDVMSGYNSRRSSYYSGGGGHDQNRYSRASYYGGRQGGRESSYDNGDGMGGPVGGPPVRMRYGNRMQSDPGWNNRQSMHNGNGNGNSVYPMHGLQQSRDTVNTNGSNGSHSDGPYSNEPSSDNSSFERAGPVQRPQPPAHMDMGDQYGSNGYGRGPQADPYGQQPSHGYPQYPTPQMNNGPPPPSKHITPPAPIKLGTSGGSPPADAERPKVLSKNSNDDKRKSWFKRRFSKE
jgi:hypothetical protein